MTIIIRVCLSLAYSEWDALGRLRQDLPFDASSLSLEQVLRLQTAASSSLASYKKRVVITTCQRRVEMTDGQQSRFHFIQIDY